MVRLHRWAGGWGAGGWGAGGLGLIDLSEHCKVYHTLRLRPVPGPGPGLWGRSQYKKNNTKMKQPLFKKTSFFGDV